jgi:hypothetical protein
MEYDDDQRDQMRGDRSSDDRMASESGTRWLKSSKHVTA